MLLFLFFVFKQKTAYEMRISDWSSDVCSSDLVNRSAVQMMGGASVQDLIQPLGYLFEESPDSLRRVMIGRFSGRKNYSEFMKIRTLDGRVQIGRASCRERVCQYV